MQFRRTFWAAETQNKTIALPEVIHYVADASNSLNGTAAVAAFLIARGEFSYFMASTGWYDDNWRWQPEYDVDYGTPLADARFENGKFTREYSRCSVTLDCADPHDCIGEVVMKPDAAPTPAPAPDESAALKSDDVIEAPPPAPQQLGELNTNASSYAVPEHVCYRILRSIEGGTRVSPQGEYRKQEIFRNASGAYHRFWLFENGDARCEAPMRDAGGEQGLLELSNAGCISEGLPAGAVSWVDTVEQPRRDGVGMLRVAAFNQAGCDGSRPRPTFANFSYGDLNTQHLHAHSVPEGACHMIARSRAGFGPDFRRVWGIANSSGEFVKSTLYADTKCTDAGLTRATKLGPACFEHDGLSFTLGWDRQAATIEQAVFEGAGCASPYSYPVNWGEGDRNVNISSYRVGIGECFRHLRGGVRPAFATLVPHTHVGPGVLTLSHFVDDKCTMAAWSEDVQAGACTPVYGAGGALANQSWIPEWDGVSSTIGGSFFVGSGCAVPGSYPVNSAAPARSLTATTAAPKRMQVPVPTPPFRAYAFTSNITADALYRGTTLSTDEGMHTTAADVRTMLDHGIVPLRNAPGPGPTAGKCLKKRLNHSACVELLAGSVAVARGAAVADGIEWSGRSINEWTLGNRTTPRRGPYSNATTLDFPAVAAEGYRLAKRRDPKLFLAAWITGPDDTFADLMNDGTFSLAMVEGCKSGPGDGFAPAG